MTRFDLYCTGCGLWHTFRNAGPLPVCPDCRTDYWLTDNEPNRSQWAGEYYGRDQDAPISDAGPGL